ncbi:ABC transporter permease subunit [Alkalihalobacterium elongatum]|uniref:ABC transporter permease subunit n=1 Tax=Alkalihalobacterium elongatum TaxID=2675466 RepID=UPI001C1FCBB9|nr:ABC transporter permease subunit [Alkalihalobacterium elongatum]
MNKQLIFSSFLLLILLFVSIIGPYFPFLQDPEDVKEYILHDDGTIEVAPFSPSQMYWLGTDHYGVDLLTLIITGGRDTLLVLLAITVIRFLIAVPLGILARKNKGFFHLVVSSLNSFFSMVPILFFALLFMNLPMIIASEYRFVLILVTLALLECGRTATAVQTQVAQIDRSAYMEGAVINGSKWSTVLRFYYWRHLRNQLIVLFFLDASRVMLLLGQLGFLSMFFAQTWVLDEAIGILVRNDLHIWPTMLADTRKFLHSNIWIPLAPAFMITITIFTLQLFGEGLRSRFEKK